MASIAETANHDFPRALGDAVVKLWGLLPPEIQHHLFEEAASHGAEERSRLAVFLHAKHPRTGAAQRAGALIEPDSLGG